MLLSLALARPRISARFSGSDLKLEGGRKQYTCISVGSKARRTNVYFGLFKELATVVKGVINGIGEGVKLIASLPEELAPGLNGLFSMHSVNEQVESFQA